MDLKKLIEERARRWARMKELNDLAEKEGRSLQCTEVEEYGRRGLKAAPRSSTASLPSSTSRRASSFTR